MAHVGRRLGKTVGEVDQSDVFIRHLCTLCILSEETPRRQGRGQFDAGAEIK
ncbi:MAG: hypothetical protein ABTQ30_20205 [Rhizobiaceae bacterium]